MISLLSEVGKEDPPADPNDFADFVRRLAGVLIEHFGVSQLCYIGSRPSPGLPPRLCRCPTGGSFCRQTQAQDRAYLRWYGRDLRLNRRPHGLRTGLRRHTNHTGPRDELDSRIFPSPSNKAVSGPHRQLYSFLLGCRLLSRLTQDPAHGVPADALASSEDAGWESRVIGSHLNNA
jgi:hypothetical protein